jgi:hypothetical protein
VLSDWEIDRHRKEPPVSPERLRAEKLVVLDVGSQVGWYHYVEQKVIVGEVICVSWFHLNPPMSSVFVQFPGKPRPWNLFHKQVWPVHILEQLAHASMEPR